MYYTSVLYLCIALVCYFDILYQVGISELCQSYTSVSLQCPIPMCLTNVLCQCLISARVLVPAPYNTAGQAQRYPPAQCPAPCTGRTRPTLPSTPPPSSPHHAVFNTVLPVLRHRKFAARSSVHKHPHATIATIDGTIDSRDSGITPKTSE